MTELMAKAICPNVSIRWGCAFCSHEGYLTDVPVNKILDFEQALLSYMRAEFGDFMKRIDETGDYDDDVVNTLKSAIESLRRPNPLTHSYS